MLSIPCSFMLTVRLGKRASACEVQAGSDKRQCLMRRPRLYHTSAGQPMAVIRRASLSRAMNALPKPTPLWPRAHVWAVTTLGLRSQMASQQLVRAHRLCR